MRVNDWNSKLEEVIKNLKEKKEFKHGKKRLCNFYY